MLLYCNRSFFRVVLSRYGSIIIRADSLTMGFILAGVSGFLTHLIALDDRYAPKLPHHYAMNALGTIVGFSVVFRTNLGWSRYWEAVGMLHLMYSKWGDAFSQLVAFSSVSIERSYDKKAEADTAKAQRVEAIVEHVYRSFLIMSSLAADRLTHGDTARMERRAATGAKWKDQIVKRETLRQCIEQETQMPRFEIAPIKGQNLRSSASIGNLEIQNTWRATYRVRAFPTEDEMEILRQATDRVTVVMYWIIYDLANASADMETAPPIQSRMYQELSNGMLGFNQCMKLADVPFPFPYAQMLSCLLCCFAVFIPVYVTAFTKSMIVSCILSFCIFSALWGLNETAKELENPFGTDDNDICLGDFHLRFMDCCEEVFDSSWTAMNKADATSEEEADEC